ncbi:MAG: hypothetical protein AB1714_23735 [Acidobacteriota bacterium]
MRKIFSALAVGTVLLISAAASETAEKLYVPLIMDTSGTLDLYWMKLNPNGSRARGPVLVRDTAQWVTSAAIVPDGNKILYAEYESGTSSQIYSVGVNPKNGTVVNGPTQLTTGATNYFYYGISVSPRWAQVHLQSRQGKQYRLRRLLEEVQAEWVRGASDDHGGGH